jgi:hypothetical protein
MILLTSSSSIYTYWQIAIKVMRDKNPTRLHDLLQQTYHSDIRNVAHGLFYDSSKSKVGEQSLQNRLKHVAKIKKPWNKINAKWTNDAIQVKLNGAFFACHAQLTVTWNIDNEIFSQIYFFVISHWFNFALILIFSYCFHFHLTYYLLNLIMPHFYNSFWQGITIKFISTFLLKWKHCLGLN